MKLSAPHCVALIVICSFNGLTPVVCCTDCKKDININTVIVGKYGGYYFKSGQKAYDECLRYVVNLPYPCGRSDYLSRKWNSSAQCYDFGSFSTIQTTAGGIDAERKEFPHMALLGYGDLETAQWACGGSVISRKFVLTAAHCISTSDSIPVTYVAVGILKRTDPPELWQRYKVKRIIPHPDYTSPSKYHDIALLETEQKIEFNDAVLPACLNTGEAYDGNAWATGWGALGYRKQLADTLQIVELIRYSKRQCSAQYPPHRHILQGYDHAKQMCYGDTEKDTCESFDAKPKINTLTEQEYSQGYRLEKIRSLCYGDSGGPLQVYSDIVPCMFVILGVTSFGKPCGYSNNSGMYTRVSYYVPWIESVVWP